MQIKLAYTIEEKDIYKELAQLIGLKGTTMQRLIDLFTKLQSDLTTEEGAVNIPQVEENVVLEEEKPE